MPRYAPQPVLEVTYYPEPTNIVLVVFSLLDQFRDSTCSQYALYRHTPESSSLSAGSNGLMEWITNGFREYGHR